MSKAPAFQFYYDRFNSSTSLWDDAQVGQYIRLMICQANKGYVSAKELKKVVHDNDPEVLNKFTEVEPGKFINTVLDEVLTERDAHRKKQYENGLKGGRPITQTITQNEPNDNPNHNPDVTSTTTTTSTTTSNFTNTPRTTKKNTAEADLYAFDRVSVVSELNELTGRAFDPNAEYFKKNLNARIKQYGSADLIDMIRFMVYKRKGTDWEQYLKPDTLFRADKCASYMVDMKHHRDNGLMPKKDTKPNGPKSAEEILAEGIASMNRKKSIFQ